MKVAVIGAGSTYTPELISGLEADELALHDIDAGRLDIVGGLAGRILAHRGFAGRLELTTELDAALDNADAVLLQIRVGGQAARLSDETVPLACGCIGQETTGAGGFAKALRTVTSRTPWGSSRAPCSTRATGRSASATWPSASSGRWRRCSASSRSASSSTRSG